MSNDGIVGDLVRIYPAEQRQADRTAQPTGGCGPRDGLLDIAYRTVDSPVGPLLLAATEQD